MAFKSSKLSTLDVRPLIARGEEPFDKIMKAVSALAPGESFVLVTPFVPAPLIELLQSQGFDARPEHRADGGWQTQFTSPKQ